MKILTKLSESNLSCFPAFLHNAKHDVFRPESVNRSAQVGIAPANADDGILKAADVIVGSNNESAVAQAVAYIEAHYC